MRKTILILLLTVSCYSLQAQIVSTFAGSAQGFANGAGLTAQFNLPLGISIDENGNLYIADRLNHQIRKITSNGDVTTLAGSTPGFFDGPSDVAQFFNPHGVAVDADGNVFVADWNNQKIRKISFDGDVTTLAGSNAGFADGIGTDAQFYFPTGVAVDASDNVYVADWFNHKIRKITSNGIVTTLAGSTLGFADGNGTTAQFYTPSSVAVDAIGNVYVTDTNNHRIRKITATGTVTTLAGSIEGFSDGAGTSAMFNTPLGIALDTNGNVYVSDALNHKIRKITANGVVTTLAGSTVGFADGIGTSAKFNTPIGIAIDATGNVYVADSENHKIRKITQPLGIGNESQTLFSVFPNPTQNDLTITMHEVTTTQNQYTIYDTNGRVLAANSLNNVENYVSLKELARGLYFLEVSNNNGKSIQRIIKE